MRSFKTTKVAGTITSANVSQKIADPNNKRDLVMLLNPAGETGVLFYNFGGAADANCMSLAVGEWVKFDQHCAVPTDSIHVTAANTGHKFVLLLGQRGNIE